MSALEPFAYAHDGLKLSGRLARPVGPGPHPAILVMHSALGPDQQTGERAQDLAKLGYVAHDGDSGRYRIGSRLAELGATVAGQFDLARIGRPIMRQIARAPAGHRYSSRLGS